MAAVADSPEVIPSIRTVEETPAASISTAQPVIAPPQSIRLPKETTKTVVHTQQKKTAFTWLPRQFSREMITRLLLPFLWQNLGWFIGG